MLVTGGTGTLGRQVVPRLQGAGCDVRVLSRHPQESADGVEYVVGDLRTDDGIESAVAGAGTIVHCAGGPKGDGEATLNLVRAASRAGARHLVYISVIGGGPVPLGYFRSKLAAEQAVTESGLPWTTLRAAQFHDLVLMAAQKMARLPVLPIPRAIRFQPVDAARRGRPAGGTGPGPTGLPGAGPGRTEGLPADRAGPGLPPMRAANTG